MSHSYTKVKNLFCFSHLFDESSQRIGPGLWFFLISSAFPVTGTKSRVDEGALQACEGGGPELEVGEVGILLRQSQRHQGQLTLPANVCVSL